MQAVQKLFDLVLNHPKSFLLILSKITIEIFCWKSLFYFFCDSTFFTPPSLKVVFL